MIPPFGPQHRPVLEAPAEFRFAFSMPARPLLGLIGIRPSTALVSIDATHLDVQFGRWHVRTPTNNVLAAHTVDHLRSWRTLGVRLSLADHGLTFGTGRRGVCVRFHRSLPGVGPFRLLQRRLRHPALTVTVVDPELLAAHLSASPVSNR